MKNYLSLDIGGTMIKYGIVSEDDNLVESYETKTNEYLGGKAIQNNILNIIKDIVKKTEISGVCISTAGIVTLEGEILENSPLNINFGAINFKKVVEEKFNLPCEIENDVNCAGLSEYYIGASKNSSSSLCLTIGTGIGGSFIVNNQLLRGFSNCFCEVGYVQIDGSDFQDIASTTTLVQNVAKRLGVKFEDINGKIIFEKAKNGDLVCLEEIDKLCDNIGKGIASICAVLNPEVVVLGGGIMEQGDFLKKRIEDSLKKYLFPIIFKNTTIAIAKNGNKAGMLGAYYNFKNKQTNS